MFQVVAVISRKCCRAEAGTFSADSIPVAEGPLPAQGGLFQSNTYIM